MLTRWRVTVPPTAEPVILADAKAQLVVDGSEDDAYITGLITTAREACEDITGRAIPSQQILVTLDAWPSGRELWWDGTRETSISALSPVRAATIEIPRVPLISVQGITTYTDADVAAVWDSSQYFVDASDPNQPGRIAQRTGAPWPVALRVRNAIEIACTVGYAVVPSGLKRAIMMMVADLYANRGDGWSASESTRAGQATDSAARSGASVLLDRYILRNL